MLEQEFQALTGAPAAPPRDLLFVPAQILEPTALARRLLEGRDRAATMLRQDLLADRQPDLAAAYRSGNVAQLRDVLRRAINGLLTDDRLFDRDHRDCFDGVTFRSQTADRIHDPDIRRRNRLILEDTFPELQKLFDIRVAELYRRAHRQQLRALALSGGGVRSATFALGVVQGLARKGLLDQFDYLSTVSGGGYIGGWLSAWIARTGLPQVVAELRRRPTRPLVPEPGPVRHLRRYSSYLAPKFGILSADTWTLGATYLRNLLLNWLAFVPPLVALLSAPLLLVQLVSWQPLGDGVAVQYRLGLLLAIAAVVGIVTAVRYVHVNRPRQRGPTEGTGTFDEKRSQRDFLHQCLSPMLIAVTAAAVCWAWGTSYSSPIGDLFRRWPGWLMLGSIGAAVHLAGWILAGVSVRRRGVAAALPWWHGPLILTSGFTIGMVASWLATFAPPLWDLTPQERGVYVLLAVPVLLGVILLCSHLYVGYASTRHSDAEREWSARFTGWVFIAIATWLIGFGLVICGPAMVRWVIGQFTTQHPLPLQWLLAAIGGGSGVGAAMIAKSGTTPAIVGKNSARTRSRLALVFASVFIAWLVIVLSWTGRQVIAVVQQLANAAEPGSTRGLLTAVGAATALFLFGLLTSRLIDTNMFSLHAMYRARLIRAYLGASRLDGSRDPNPFTGFDDGDNMHLRELWPAPAPAGGNQRPLHVINATLNLVAGDNLAWQERQAESFTFSPLHCGSVNVGYRATQDDPCDPTSGGYAGERGVSLGTAMAISGAAASPAMGYHSSPVLSLLLTFFNVRLGWWLGNPGHAGRAVYHRSSPKLSLDPIMDEALGRTDDRNKYVYLSDGGHFENLGLYEMVLRRCHVIVVTDATSDPTSGCADLGNAIRKIRIDLGIPIDIDITASATCAIGVIRYGCVDGDAPDGVLVYLKPALGADDPADVQAYARANTAFPHESTADQWFTESQFESYRQLGSHIIETIAGGEPPNEGATMAWFVERVKEYRRSC